MPRWSCPGATCGAVVVRDRWNLIAPFIVNLRTLGNKYFQEVMMESTLRILLVTTIVLVLKTSLCMGWFVEYWMLYDTKERSLMSMMMSSVRKRKIRSYPTTSQCSLLYDIPRQSKKLFVHWPITSCGGKEIAISDNFFGGIPRRYWYQYLFFYCHSGTLSCIIYYSEKFREYMSDVEINWHITSDS